jgi:hypothetical protein
MLNNCKMTINGTNYRIHQKGVLSIASHIDEDVKVVTNL